MSIHNVTKTALIGILGLALGWEIARAATVPTGFTAAWGTDTQINLSWNAVGDATDYYVYRLKPTPIDLSGATVSSGTADGAVSWVNPGNAFDGSYSTNTYTSGGANYTANDWVQVNLASNAYIGAVGVIQTRQPESVNWYRNDFALDMNGSTVSSGNFQTNAGGGAGGRNLYYTVYNGTPMDANSVRLTMQGGVTDSRSAITAIDLWEFERIATLGAGTTSFNDNNGGSGLNTGQSYAYFVTSYDGSTQSGLSNYATMKAGDRDDTNSGDTTAPVQSQPWRNGAYYSAVQPGASDALPAKVQVPDAPTNFTIKANTITFDASPTEESTGDVRQYAIYRATATDPVQIQTNGTLISKRVMPGQGNVLDGNPTTAGRRAYSNYSESDDIVSFGQDNYYAMVKMVIHQEDGGSPQHHYRGVAVEAAGGYMTAGINMTTVNNYTTTAFSGTDGSGYATFGFSPKVEGELPETWIVGDHVILHMYNGENSVDHGEYEIWGLPIEFVGYVSATGAASYLFTDSTAQLFDSYNYYIMAEDFAYNQSVALFSQIQIIPEPASLAMLALGALALVRRRG